MPRPVYIVFSATPTRLGRLIRLATGYPYNHVSLSLEQDLSFLWSFARYHQNAPLYGGLVRESLLRYQGARLKVCRLPVTEEQYTALTETLERCWQERDSWLYNTPAALASLAGCRPLLPRTHTCASFVLDLLKRFSLTGVPLPSSPTIPGLERALEPFRIWEGPAPQGTGWGKDPYPRRLPPVRVAWTTARHFGLLARRAVLGLA